MDVFSMCATCLSGERTLARLGDLRAVYVALTDCDPRADTRVCWECAAALRRAARFRLRAARAQAWLQSAGAREHPDVKSATSLRITPPALDVQINPETPIMAHQIKVEITEEPAPFRTTEFYSCTDDVTASVPSSQDFKIECDIPNTTNRFDFVSTNSIPIETDNADRFQGAFNVKTENEITDATGLLYVEVEHIDVKPKRKRNRKRKNIEQKESKFETVKVNETELLKYRQEERDRGSYQRANFKCDLCVLTFRAESYYEQHYRAAHLLEPFSFTCRICETRFTKKPTFDFHVQKHFKLYRCRICSLTRIGRNQLYRHFKEKHKLVKTFDCTTCCSTFPQTSLLKEHLQEVHNKQDNLCECYKCGKKFKYRSVMEKHMKTHEATCPICSRKFSNKVRLSNHYSFMHAVAPDPSEVFCKPCDKQFKTAMSYKSHLSAVHNSKPKTRISCTDCEKTFSGHLYFKKHYQQCHLNDKKFYCNICKRSFICNYTLKMHTRRVHDGAGYPKTHTCDICHRTFPGKMVLVNHIRTHTGERPHKCDECGAAFAQKYCMERHVKVVHQGIRDVSIDVFICDECGKTYNFRKYIVRHLKIHDVACPMCNCNFFRKTHLDYHLQTKHDGAVASTTSNSTD